MGHPQPPTSVALENTAARRIVNGTTKQKNKFNRHDILLRQIQNTKKLFLHIMMIGKEKLAGYVTKHNTIWDRKKIRSIYLEAKTKKKLKIPSNWDRNRVCWNYQSQGNLGTG